MSTTNSINAVLAKLTGNHVLTYVYPKTTSDNIRYNGTRTDIPATLTEFIDSVSDIEKTTTIDASSTNMQVPTAKAVYDLFTSIVDGNEVSY